MITFTEFEAINILKYLRFFLWKTGVGYNVFIGTDEYAYLVKNYRSFPGIPCQSGPLFRRKNPGRISSGFVIVRNP